MEGAERAEEELCSAEIGYVESTGMARNEETAGAKLENAGSGSASGRFSSPETHCIWIWYGHVDLLCMCVCIWIYIMYPWLGMV